MNKHLGLIICIAVMVGACSAATVHAEIRKGEILFGPYGLYAIPTDDYPSPKLEDVPYVDFGADVEPSPGLSAGADRLLTRNFSLGGEFKVYFGTVDERVMQEFLDNHIPDLDEVEVTWRTVHIGARARYYFQPDKRLNPYLHGGVGMYLSKLRAEFRKNKGSGSSNNFSRSESNTDPGVSVGTGALLRFSKDARVSVDAIFTNVFSSERSERYLGLSLGLIFSVMPD